jgi:hypothetical protein
MSSPAHIPPSSNQPGTPFTPRENPSSPLPQATNAIRDTQAARRVMADSNLRGLNTTLKMSQDEIDARTAQMYNRILGENLIQPRRHNPPIQNPYGVLPQRKNKEEPAVKELQKKVSLIKSHEGALEGLSGKKHKTLKKEIDKERQELAAALKKYVASGLKEALHNNDENLTYSRSQIAMRIYLAGSLQKIGNVFTRAPLMKSINQLRNIGVSYISKATHVLKNGPGEFYSRLSMYDSRIKEKMSKELQQLMIKEEKSYYLEVIHPALEKDINLRNDFFYHLIDQNPPDMPIRQEMKDFLNQERKKFEREDL